MPKDPSPAYHILSCLCGADVRVNPLSADRRVSCPACKSPLSFVVSMDQKLKKPRVSMVIPLGQMKTEGTSLGSGPTRAEPPAPPPAATRYAAGKTTRGVIASCVCGGTFPVSEEELTTIQSCPQCKVSYHVVVKRDENKKKSAILVPVKPIGHHAGSHKTFVASKPPPSSTRTRGRTQGVPAMTRSQAVSKKARTQVSRVPPPPPQVPPGAQAIPCFCGATLVVRKRDLERGLTCGSCDRRLKFQETRDPQTLSPTLRVLEDR